MEHCRCGAAPLQPAFHRGRSRLRLYHHLPSQIFSAALLGQQLGNVSSVPFQYVREPGIIRNSRGQSQSQPEIQHKSARMFWSVFNSGLNVSHIEPGFAELSGSASHDRLLTACPSSTVAHMSQPHGFDGVDNCVAVPLKLNLVPFLLRISVSRISR